MPVPMTGSPNASFTDLQKKTLAKAQKKAEAKLAQKKKEEALFKQRQNARAEQQKAERENRAVQRSEALKQIANEHEGWVHREADRERAQKALGRAHMIDMADGVHKEDDIIRRQPRRDEDRLVQCAREAAQDGRGD